jgi:hypothetical protein
MRLDPLEVYVLESFRLEGRSRLRMDVIAEKCTVIRRDALKEAVERLERHRLVVRHAGSVELTPAGRRFLDMADAEAHERL